jgi:hypothetical protein
MIEYVTFLAQDLDLGWLESMIYLLVFILLPALGSLGSYIRKKSGAGRDAETVDDKEGDVVVFAEPTAPKQVPEARPLPPSKPVVKRAEVRTPPPVKARPVTPRRAKPRSPEVGPAVSSFLQMGIDQATEAGRRPNQPLRPSPPAAQRRVRKQRSEWLGSLSVADLRRAIVLREVLGPPRALQPFEGPSELPP